MSLQILYIHWITYNILQSQWKDLHISGFQTKPPSWLLVSPRKAERSVPKVVRVSKTHSFMPVCPQWSDGHDVFVHTTLRIGSSRKEKLIVHLPNSTNEMKSQAFDILLLYSPSNTSIKHSLQYFLGGMASRPSARTEAMLWHKVSFCLPGPAASVPWCCTCIAAHPRWGLPRCAACAAPRAGVPHHQTPSPQGPRPACLRRGRVPLA